MYLSIYPQALFQGLSQTVTDRKGPSYAAIEALRLEFAIRHRKPRNEFRNSEIKPETPAIEESFNSIENRNPLKAELTEVDLAAIKIQAMIRGYLVRMLMEARVPGTSFNSPQLVYLYNKRVV